MTLPPQYINWRAVPRTDGGVDKVPFDPSTGRNIDPLDPKNWKDEATARSTGHPVGFVFTMDDPYFLIDLDKQRDPVTGAWTDAAKQVAAMFSGAMMEVSQSGTGMHIIGSCDQGAIESAGLRNRWDGAFEFYHKDRFVAFGPYGWHGDPHLDCTAKILSWVPRRPDATRTGLPDTGPVPEYTGPQDDDDLLRAAMSARGSAGTAFGDTASFKALWEADRAVLCRLYPSDTPDEYDHSRADSALVSHLAFWTGKDAARIERLWRRSALAAGQPKMSRADYVRRTIENTAGSVRSVYDKPTAGVSEATVTGDSGDAYKTTMDQIELFDGCVYVEADHAILTPTGALLDPARFKVAYGGYEFQMEAGGSRPTRDAFEAFTINRAIRFQRASRRVFRPDRPFGEVVDGEVNTFRLPDTARGNGSVKPFTDLLERVLPNERDRRILLTWCAAMVQNPGVKFQWAIVLQGVEGNGKTFILKCLEQAVGRDYTHLPNPEDMHEKYNGYIEENLLIGVEEVHMAGRRELLDRLKKYITNDRVEVRNMGQEKRMVDNLTNWFFLTNWQDAVMKSRNDRRYCIMFTAQQEESDLERDGMNGDFFPRLWDWARDGGFADVAGFLSRYECDAEFNPAAGCHRAPRTSTSDVAIEVSLGPVEQEIQEAIEEGIAGFRGGWISSVKLRDRMRERGVKVFSGRVLGDAVRNIGYIPCPLWVDGRAPPMAMEGGLRPRLYCTPHTASVALSVDDYIRAQGYEPPQLHEMKKTRDG